MNNEISIFFYKCLALFHNLFELCNDEYVLNAVIYSKPDAVLLWFHFLKRAWHYKTVIDAIFPDYVSFFQIYGKIYIFHSTILKMNHSQATHEKVLNSLCRICGETALKTHDKKKYKKPYFIDDVLVNDLAFDFDIHIKNDLFHSKYMCHKCHRLIGNGKKRKSTVTKQTLQDRFITSKHIWMPFDIDIDEESCLICVSMQIRRFSFGRRKLPETANSCPKSQSTTATHRCIHDVNSVQPESPPIPSSDDTYNRDEYRGDNEACTLKNEPADYINMFIKEEIILSKDEICENDIKGEPILLKKEKEGSSEEQVVTQRSNNVHSQLQKCLGNETPIKEEMSFAFWDNLNIKHDSEDKYNCSETEDILKEGHSTYSNPAPVKLQDRNHDALPISSTITQQKAALESLGENCGVSFTSGNIIQGIIIIVENDIIHTLGVGNIFIEVKRQRGCRNIVPR